MKLTNFFATIAVILTLTLLALGCSKDDGSVTGPPPSKPKAAGTMTALIDGVSWAAGNNPTGEKSAYSWYTLSTGHLSIYGKQYDAPATTGKSIDIAVPAFGEGTFNLGNGGGYAIYKSTNPYFESDIIHVTGSVTLTKVDKVNKIVKGTFWCQVKGFSIDVGDYVYVNITNGAFDVEYVGEN